VHHRPPVALLSLALFTACVEPVAQDSGNMNDVNGIEFVRLQGHTFNMGCTPGQPSCGLDGEHVQEVTLTRDYHMSRTEVTQEQFEAVMGYSRPYFMDCGPTCPVERLTWHEAAAFANEMSAFAGLPECFSCTGYGETVTCAERGSVYDCSGFRLPTEAEWEAAARCGEDLMYAGSETSTEVAWLEDNSGGTTKPVGELPPNACGLVDMSGNVFEWTQDWYTAYTGQAATDPMGPESALRKVFRGGSWGNVSGGVPVAGRLGTPPTTRLNSLGVRLVRTAD